MSEDTSPPADDEFRQEYNIPLSPMMTENSVSLTSCQAVSFHFLFLFQKRNIAQHTFFLVSYRINNTIALHKVRFSFLPGFLKWNFRSRGEPDHMEDDEDSLGVIPPATAELFAGVSHKKLEVVG